MRELFDWDDHPEEQELLLQVLVQQQRIMEELCAQISAVQLAAQKLSGNTCTGSSEFPVNPGCTFASSSSRYPPGDREGGSNAPDIRRQEVVQAGQPEQQPDAPAASFIRSAIITDANQHPLNPSKDIAFKMAERWEFGIDLPASLLDQSTCTSLSLIPGVNPAPELTQLVSLKLDSSSGSCQTDDNSVDEHKPHNLHPTHLGKNSAPDGNSVTVNHSSHGEPDVIDQSLNLPSLTSGPFSEFCEDRLEQVYDESPTGGGALRANKKANNSTKNADVFSVLVNRASRCAAVQISELPERRLQREPVRDVVIFTKEPCQLIQVFNNRSCSRVRNIFSKPQHNVGRRTQQSKYTDVFIRRMGLCTTTKVKLSHATVFQPERPDVCSLRSAVAVKTISLQQSLEDFQYEPWDPGA